MVPKLPVRGAGFLSENSLSNTIINSWDTGQQLGGAAEVERTSGKLKERVLSGCLGFTSLEETDYILLAA